jgi:hypothetical protein
MVCILAWDSWYAAEAFNDGDACRVNTGNIRKILLQARSGHWVASGADRRRRRDKPDLAGLYAKRVEDAAQEECDLGSM